MFKKILVATDGSDYSRHALTTAVSIAKQFQSEIELLHVVIQPLAYANFIEAYSVPFSEEEVNEIGKAVFEKTLVGIDTEKVAISQKVVVGYPSTAILEEIANKVDLIIIGSRGHSPLGGAITGSVTLSVLAHAPCPVLVVK